MDKEFIIFLCKWCGVLLLYYGIRFYVGEAFTAPEAITYGIISYIAATVIEYIYRKISNSINIKKLTPNENPEDEI